MDLEKVKELIALAKNEGLEELKIESKDGKFEVKLPYAQSQLAPQLIAQPQVVVSASTQNEGASAESRNLTEITSPFVGTFYRSSSPEAEAYVNVGDRISSGKALCIVEAMKIMNEIESEISGEIVEICVENETYVEFGQVLFLVKA